MSRSKRTLVLISVLALSAIVTAAETPSEPVTMAPPETVTLEPEETIVAPRVVNPLMEAIEAKMEEARRQRDALQEQADAVTDAATFLKIQRQIERLHRDTELAILEIQVEHFRQLGLLDAVRRIENAIAVMSTPRPGIPEPRPIPEAQPEG